MKKAPVSHHINHIENVERELDGRQYNGNYDACARRMQIKTYSQMWKCTAYQLRFSPVMNPNKLPKPKYMIFGCENGCKINESIRKRYSSHFSANSDAEQPMCDDEHFLVPMFGFILRTQWNCFHVKKSSHRYLLAVSICWNMLRS